MTCVFCKYAGPSKVLADYGDAYIIEPLNPVVSGHLLAVSTDHIEGALMDPDVTGRLVVAALDYANLLGVGDCNLIVNNGPVATQTIPHLHAHLVPRSRGDGLTLPWTHLHPHGEEGLELLSARFHDIYQKEAHRRGDVRHEDRYEDLPEPTKEWDRVLARWVLEHWTPKFDSSQGLPPA